MALKNTLSKLKDNVVKEAAAAKAAAISSSVSEETQGQNTKKITNWIKQIASKVPQITKLEKKLGML